MPYWRSTAGIPSRFSWKKMSSAIFIMSAVQAKEYGLIDEIITKHR